MTNTTAFPLTCWHHYCLAQAMTWIVASFVVRVQEIP